MTASRTDLEAYARAVRERQIATLDELSGMGMELARCIKDKATAAEDPEAFAPAFAKAGRCVRLTLLLQDRIIEHMLGKAEAKAEPACEPITQITRILVQPNGERFNRETGERLDREDEERLDREVDRPTQAWCEQETDAHTQASDPQSAGEAPADDRRNRRRTQTGSVGDWGWTTAGSRRRDSS